MSSKNGFMRKFIILRGRKTSYSDSKKTKGHVKIEVRDGKGKIAFNVEGLKHIDDVDKIYKGYLVRKEQNQIIKAEIGVLEINKNGQGKTEYKVDPQYIGNSGLQLNEFQAIMVTLSSYEEDGQNVSIPLVGFIEEDSDVEEMIQKMQFTVKEARTKEKSQEDREELPEDNEELQQNPLEEMKEEQSEANELKEEHQVEDKIEEETEEKHIETEDVQGDTDVQDKTKLETKEDDAQEEVTEYQENETSNEDLEVELQETVKVEEDDEEGQEQEQQEQEQQEQEQEQEQQQEQAHQQQVKHNNKYIKIDGKHEDYFLSEEDKAQDDEQEQEKVDWFNSDFQNPYGYSINKDTNNENRNEIYNYQIANYTLNILKFFEKVEPLKNDLKDYEFWEIEYDENNLYRGFLPYYNYVVSMYYPYPSMYRTTTCQSLIKKYKHYIFGVVMENEKPKYYIYGIPGKFKKSEHPYRGSTGFNTWLQRKDYEEDKLGYWLLHIDTTTGKVASPLRTTRPR